MATKDKILIVDIDGVILDYHQGIIEAYESHYVETDNPESLDDIFSPTLVNGIITLFNQTPKFSELEPYRESDVYLKKLFDEGFKIHAITACGDGLLTQQLRMDNLLNVFGDIFASVEYVPLGSSKVDLLKNYRDSQYVYVEDRFEHYVDAESLGIDAVMMETNFNKNIDCNKVKNWKEVYDYIKKSY